MIMTSIKYFSVVGPGGGDWNGICGTVGGESGEPLSSSRYGTVSSSNQAG